MRVVVIKNGALYECQPRVKQLGFHCGKCGTGVVYPTVGDTCMICGSVVERVE